MSTSNQKTNQKNKNQTYKKTYDDVWENSKKSWLKVKGFYLDRWKSQENLSEDKLLCLSNIYEELFSFGANILWVDLNLTHQKNRMALNVMGRNYKFGPWWVRKNGNFNFEAGPGQRVAPRNIGNIFIRNRKKSRPAFVLIIKQCRKFGIDFGPILLVQKLIKRKEVQEFRKEMENAQRAEMVKKNLPKNKMMHPLILELQKALINHLASLSRMNIKSAISYASKLCFFVGIDRSQNIRTMGERYWGRSKP